MYRINFFIKSTYKYLKSFFKSDWDLTDYPLNIRNQKSENSDLSNSRFKLVLWSIDIINWHSMSGNGDTFEEAYNHLEKRFIEYKKSEKKFPRPGTKVPIEFVTTENIYKYEEIASDFLSKILDIDYYETFISDESSLWDFHFEENDDELVKKIFEIYKVDISDIENRNLVKIFDKISKHQEEKNHQRLS